MPPTRAVCRVPGGIVYLSREGPIAVSAGRSRELVRALITREEFTLRYGDVMSDLRLAYHDGRLLAYVAGSERGFVVSVADPADTVQWDLPLAGYTAVGDLTLPADNRLVLLASPDRVSSTALKLFDPEISRMPASYWTRDFLLTKPENLGAIQVLASGHGRVSAFVYAEREPWSNITFDIDSDDEVRCFDTLPGGLKARRWSVLLTMDPGMIVTGVALASTPGELAGA